MLMLTSSKELACSLKAHGTDGAPVQSSNLRKQRSSLKYSGDDLESPSMRIAIAPPLKDAVLISPLCSLHTLARRLLL